MKPTIVLGYDDRGAARRALDRALEEAKTSGAQLVVVSDVELPLDPQAPRNFGTLDDGPAPIIPPVVPEELERVIAHGRDQVAAAGSRPTSSGRPAIPPTSFSTWRASARRRSSWSAPTTTASWRGWPEPT
jgi:nucleotide-binding universal stress UspA family protein